MAITTMGVTTLFEVFDMHRSVAFYCDVLGFEVTQKWEPDGQLGWVMLKLGGARLMLNACYEDNERPAAPEGHRVAGHADTELYFECADVEEAYMHLLANGISAQKPQITHYRTKQVWVTDPDGFRLCFQQPIQ